ETALGHLSTRVRGSRDEMLRALNTRLAQAAGDVLIVDCDRVAGNLGKSRWFDDRYWHVAKQAVALDALPELARHTAAVLAATAASGDRNAGAAAGRLRLRACAVRHAPLRVDRAHAGGSSSRRPVQGAGGSRRAANASRIARGFLREPRHGGPRRALRRAEPA